MRYLVCFLKIHYLLVGINYRAPFKLGIASWIEGTKDEDYQIF